MPWIIQIKSSETLTINGARLAFHQSAKVCLLDQARIVLPDGRVREGEVSETSQKQRENHV